MKDFLIFRVLGGAGAGAEKEKAGRSAVGAKPGAVFVRSGGLGFIIFSKGKIGNMLHILV